MSTTNNAIDLTTEDGVRAYLVGTSFESIDVLPLSGGTANYVYRLRLAIPHKGRGTLVLKHAQPYVKDYKALKFSLERQTYEVAALKHVREWLPSDSVVTVPEVHLFDEELHVIVMDDAGEDAVPLKAFLKQSGPVDIPLAREIGSALGEFLGKMHKWGQGNKKICDAVKGNIEAQQMSAWAFYGRLVDTLSGNHQLAKLSDPLLVVDQENVEVARVVAKETTELLMHATDTFVMGDFWPGNLMIQLDAESKLKNIFVLDWELAKNGLISTDIGQFCAEIHLLGRCYPERCKETAPAILDNFMDEYKTACEPTVEVVRRALIQWGTHMAVLGARVDWGDKEITREVTREGTRILVDGYKSEESKLKETLVGRLLESF
ncbi:hypothetical protein CPC08DRAFT_681640 [Agrocybe pediades]|nr:hypothetical protein CPC08DRAFT_681640 [Agrocybe pediades]